MKAFTVVFLFHPNECLDIGEDVSTTKRTKNPIEYLFADLIRHRLKLLDEILSLFVWKSVLIEVILWHWMSIKLSQT